MKNIVLSFILSLCFISGIMAQDIIVRKDGSETKAKVLEINSNNIKYKRFDNLEGPLYTEPKSDITKIKYQNGTEDIFVPQKIETKAEKSIPKLINSKKNVRYAGIAETGFGLGMQTKETKMALSYMVTLTQGALIDNADFVGVGFGIEGEGYIDARGPYGYIPIYGNYRHYFKHNQLSSFVSLSAGWRAPITKVKEINGGLWSNIAVGIRFGKLTASAGTYVKTYQYKNTAKNNKDTFTNLGLMFNIGFSF